MKNMLYFLKGTSINIITIVLLLILLIYCIYLISKINRLKKEIEDLNNKNVIEIDKKLTYNDKNIIPIKNISNERKINNKNQQQKPKIELYKPEIPKKKEESKAYSKNVLKEINRTTSPININNIEFNIDELVPNKKEIETNYLEEVSKKIQEEIDNKPIALTEYEQEEELNAIISYKELLNSNEKKSSIEDVDSEDFLEQLKKLRSSL